ncbi:MAG TPA: S8 family serine peptidase, partial [Luteimonas sp.]|nr:S8 family serine peptidase [Luteimonas sp.]
GCAHAPRMAQPLAGMDVSRDLVLAVENPIAAPAPHAGSNLLGYGSADQYRNGQRASATLAALKREYALRELAGWPIKPLGLYCAVLRPAPGADREALLQALGRDARVRLVEPLHEYSLYSQPAAGERYNDPYVGLQRGFADIHAAQAQRVSRGNGVEVALVDTGVDRSHPDLAGRIRAVHDLVQAPDGGTADRHGTEVAGVIAAVGNNHLGIVGVAPEATLSVYRACWGSADGKGARCNTFTLAKALAALADSPARIVNMSLGGPEDPLLSMLLGTLLREGRVVVAALPPTGMVEGFPAAVPGVIVVGPAAPARSAAGVVNAPGVDILTTQPRGGYDFASGSSLAAAHVSGVAALLLSLAPDLDAGVVRGILARSSAVQAGNGALVNAAAAVGLVGGPTARAARR